MTLHYMMDIMSQDSKVESLWEILVPCEMPKADSKGCVSNYEDLRPVRVKHHRNWDNFVRKLTGGLTIYRPAMGQWLHHGSLFKERMIPVRIMCDRKIIDRIAEFTASHYRQLAVFYYKVSTECHIVISHPVENQLKK